jgi:hypothetical protein
MQFAGIVLSYALAPAEPPADQTPRLHLGIARAADSVLELLRSPEALDHVKRIRASKLGKQSE